MSRLAGADDAGDGDGSSSLNSFSSLRYSLKQLRLKNRLDGEGPNLKYGTVISPESLLLLLCRLLMRRDYGPIIITLADPENYGGSSYLLPSAAKI